MHELFGAAADGGMGVWGPIANLAATSIIALLLVWILIRRDPEERKAHAAELGAARTEYHTSLVAVLEELAEERRSREATSEKFTTLIADLTDRYMEMITQHRERSHEQRMEDRKVYLEATQTLLRESLSAMKEIKNGHA